MSTSYQFHNRVGIAVCAVISVAAFIVALLMLYRVNRHLDVDFPYKKMDYFVNLDYEEKGSHWLSTALIYVRPVAMPGYQYSITVPLFQEDEPTQEEIDSVIQQYLPEKYKFIRYGSVKIPDKYVKVAEIRDVEK